MTIFSEFRRGNQLATVNFFVARNAERDSVCNFNGEFGMSGKKLNMMCVKFSFVSAMLASVFIAFKNRFAPNFQRAFIFLSDVRVSAFPSWMINARFIVRRTFMRAKLLRLFVSGKRFIAKQAFALFGLFGTFAPTNFRTMFCSFSAVCFNHKSFMANDTGFGDLSVLHYIHYNTIAPEYVAVTLERWQILTGKTPELIDG